MLTKFVYVLTCVPEATYIEQALISIWSARYHNPDAYIVLLVDNKTNQLLVGQRAEVVKYISERIVVDVPAEFNVMQASRWIKTNVRNLIDGDFLFIDCDTIITQTLEEVDKFECQIGAVLDSHRPVSAFQIPEKINLIQLASLCNWDFSGVERYYSSGILYVKDSKETRTFYHLWHKNYLYSSKCGVNIDQISLEKTVQELPIIKDIDDIWNTIMFIRPNFIESAKIIHFPSLDNNSFLFSKRVLDMIKINGLSDYVKYYIAHPIQSFLPYMKKYYIGRQFCKTIKVVSNGVRLYAKNVDASFIDLKIPHRIAPMIKGLFRYHCFYIGTFIWLFWIRLTRKYNPLDWYYSQSV